ncbi:MAG TPA: zf-HC2 domain-containing protein [Gemmatimonadales bacterium]
MSHLDEGTLHALLDGELETNEVAEIQAHLGACSACGLRLREVKEFLAESDRLIAAVELGEVATPPAASPAPSAARPPRREAPEPRATDPWDEPPPLFLPDNETAADRKAHRLRRLNQAAMLAVVVGAGLLWNNLYRGHSGVPRDEPEAAASAPAAVVSPQETARPDSTPTLAVADTAPTRQVARAATPAAPRPAAARTESQRDTQPTPVRHAESRPAAAELAANDTGPTADSGADTERAAPSGDSTVTEDMATVRQRAAEALAELDRERRRDRAAAATAALDAQKRRRPAATTAPAAAAAPAPAPPAPTPEQRAGIYLRIGLDEAARQLGAPAHVIEGMVPMFMGLAQGSTVTGADDTRPVVRVVYQDPQGRLILLDQQRLRQGQRGPSAPLAWTQGDHALWLHGEPSAEILRAYRARVR